MTNDPWDVLSTSYMDEVRNRPESVRTLCLKAVAKEVDPLKLPAREQDIVLEVFEKAIKTASAQEGCGDFYLAQLEPCYRQPVSYLVKNTATFASLNPNRTGCPAYEGIGEGDRGHALTGVTALLNKSLYLLLNTPQEEPEIEL